MVERFGGWGFTERGRDGWIVEKSAHQRLERKVGKAVDGMNQRRPQFLYVFAGVRNVVRQLELVRRSAAQLVEVELEAAVEAADLCANLDHVSLVKAGGNLGEILPHARFNLSGAVGESDSQVLAAILSAAQLLGCHGEKRHYSLIFDLGQVRYGNLFYFALGLGWARRSRSRCRG